MNCAVTVRFKNEAAKTVCAPALARSARVPLVVVETMVLPRTFPAVFARRVAEVEINATGLIGADSYAVAFAAEQDVRLFLAEGQGFGDFTHGNNGLRAIVQRRHKRARGAQHVEHDARGIAQIASGQHGQFRRRKNGIEYHKFFGGTSYTSPKISNRSKSISVSYNSPLRFNAGILFHFCPHVMEKILLGVTGVRAEMRRGKMPQPFVTDPAARKIEFAQRALDPDVHGKRAVKTIGEEQDAIGNFAADAAQFHQFPARFRQRQMPQPFQIEFAIGNLARGGEQMRRAKTHFARAEFGFGGGGEPLRRGKGMEQMIFFGRDVPLAPSLSPPGGERCLGALASRRRIVMLRAGETPALPGGCGPDDRFAKSFAEQGDDLPDLDDLFGRGQNERRETFPRVLPQHAQSATRGHRIAHRRVIGKSFEHGGQIRFGLQIVAQPLPVGDRPGGFGANAVAPLCQAHPMPADDAGPGIIAGLPAEGLAGVQRRGQIVIANAEEISVEAFPNPSRPRLASSLTRTRTRRNQRQSRPSAFGFQFPLRTSYFSLQIVARPEMHAAEDAVADFDFEFAEVGDGLEFLEHSRRQGKRRRHFAVTDRLMRQPFPKPAGFERVGVKFADVNGVLALAMGAIVVFRPKIQLVFRLHPNPRNKRAAWLATPRAPAADKM